MAWLLLWMPVAIPLGRVFKWRPFRYTSPTQKLLLVVSLYALSPIVVWGAAWGEQVPLTAYGLFWHVTTLQSLIGGFVLGVLGLAILFLVQWSLGWLQVLSPLDAEAFSSTELAAPIPANQPLRQSARFIAKKLAFMLFSTLAIGLWISFTEELVFRGFLVHELQQDYAPWLAVTIASLIFALLHLVWEGKETLPQLPGLWLMGIVLSLAYSVNSSNLGLAIGLHTGWIWTIASLDTAQLIHYTGKGSEWLTGLNGKPLAGLLGILFLIGTAGILLELR